MKKFFKCAGLFFFFLNLFCLAGYSSDEKQALDAQQAQIRSQQVSQSPQPPRPVTQPVVPYSPVGIAPTPPPQIAMPPITPGPINTPSAPFPQNPQPFIQQSLPSFPVQARMPITANVQHQLPETPVIGNSLGKVLEMGAENDGTPWIKVKDELFDETLKIKVNPKSTPVIKGSASSNYSDIKVGDSVNVIFNQNGEDITANFVSILTEEDLKAMEAGSKNESKDKTPPKQ
ncbi:MAG: hypothetical protein Q8O12_03585 [Candidatus Omnitrophota bacterium]|nr:hypothetical protein [Candidatus Omnitrophota bacterium]